MRCTGCGKLTVTGDVARFHWAACVMRLTAHRDGPQTWGLLVPEGPNPTISMSLRPREMSAVSLHMLSVWQRVGSPILLMPSGVFNGPNYR